MVRLLNRGCLLLLLKLSVALGSLWILSLLHGPTMCWNPTYALRYSWFDYTDIDGGPETVCNCSAILRGDREALEQAKLLGITKDFRKSVQIPDEYYINATKDCRFVSLYSFQKLIFYLF